jgi:hypothetical protein
MRVAIFTVFDNRNDGQRYKGKVVSVEAMRLRDLHHQTAEI